MDSRVSLSTRLTRWYLGTFLVLLMCGFILTWFTVDKILDHRIDTELAEDVDEFREIFDESDLEGLKQEIIDEQSDEDNSSEFYLLASKNGDVIFQTGLAEISHVDHAFTATDSSLEPTYHLGLSDRLTAGEDGGELVSYREATFALGKELYMMFGESIEQKAEVMDTLAIAFIGILLLIVPVAGYIGWRVVRRSVKGIEQISQIAYRIQRGHMGERVEFASPDKEIHQLSRAFNTMLDCIRDLIVEMREMTDNIAHDLKSPIARIRFMSEVALSRNLSTEDQTETASNTIAECDRLLKMIDISLDVAEAEAGMIEPSRLDLDLSELVSEACELFEPVAEQKNVSFDREINPGCTFFGSPSAIQRMVANLLDNAFKYCDQGDLVRVSFRYSDEVALFTVTDNGIGIAPEHQSQVFNRFFRCDRSRAREGCGLGLSFSRAVARQYGGDISLESTPGRGSTFTLTLPIDHQVRLSDNERALEYT